MKTKLSLSRIVFKQSIKVQKIIDLKTQIETDTDGLPKKGPNCTMYNIKEELVAIYYHIDAG